jgi:hypothetical protein
MRYKFGICHKEGSKFVYVIGGKDTNTSDNLRISKKFDLKTLEWIEMPNMKKERFGPGVFASSIGNVLYAFGGQENSVERILLDKEGAEWTELEVELPDQIANKYGFSILPAWNFSQVIPEISD